jgi:Beta-galactosidase C-terminal domain
VPEGVEVTSRETPDAIYYFLLNLVDSPHDVRLPQPMDELISQQAQITQVPLAPLGVAVLGVKRT